MVKRAAKKIEDEEEEEEELYEVNKILDHRRSRNGLEYFVSWVGYEESRYNTWEPENCLEGAPAKVKQYWKTVSADRRGDQKAPSKFASSSKKRRSSSQQAKQVDSDDEDLPAPKKARTASNGASTASSSAKRNDKRSGVDEDDAEEIEKAKTGKSETTAKSRKGKASVVDQEESNDSEQAKHDVGATDVPDDVEEEDDEEDGYIDGRKQVRYHLDKYAKRTSLEDLISHIETIETGTENGRYKMMAIWKEDDSFSWLPSHVYRQKCPVKVIDFFEKHLKFKAMPNPQADDVDEDDE